MPRPPDQEPVETVEDGPLGGTRLDHPAYAQIGASRVSGSQVLYGSDFVHHNHVRIHILRSQLRRSLYRDWHYGRNEIIEIALSEAQWATFVSSMNVGQGVPCTIMHENGKQVPGIPLRDEGQKFKPEADAKLAETIETVKKALAEIETTAAGLSKAKIAALKEPLRKVLQDLECNLPFVAESLGKHMETRTEKAKIEIEAYVNQEVHRAGLDAISNANGKPPIEIAAMPPTALSAPDAGE